MDSTVQDSPIERLDDRAVGLVGLASIAVMVLGALAAAMAYSGHSGEAYSPLNHFVSELGEVPTSRLAWVFNTAIVANAIGLTLCLVLLSRRLSGPFRPAIITAGLIAGSAGALVGVFPMNVHAVHRPIAFAYFLTCWIVVAIFSAWLLVARRQGFPRLLLVPGAIQIAASIAFVVAYSAYRPADPNAPILDRPDVWGVTWLEWAALLTMLAWFACVSLVLVRRRTPEMQEPAPGAGS
jgi:hypothetical membrane protein